MISIENLEKELKNNHLNSMYLLYGEELFLLETSLKKIKTLFGECIKGINFISIDDTNVEQLIADIETPAFGYEKKLIIARNTGLFKKEGKRKNTEISKLKDKINKYIQENSKLIEESVVLVFAEEEADSKQELYKTIEEIGIVCKFDFQKPIQIEKRMKAICNAYKVQIDDSTLRYFIECCGTNMQDLINEIKDVCRQISCTEQWFQAENDSDLIEACIHQREVLYAKYRYLMRKAKNDNIYVSPFEPKCV